MKNKLIGISTASGYEFLSLEKRFELFERAGFQSIMLWWGDDEVETRKERVALSEKYNLKIENVHADMDNSNSLWRQNQSGDEKLKELLTAVDDCNNFGIKCMVIHITNGSTPPELSDIGIKRLELLFDRAIKKDIVLAVENIRVEGSEHIKFIFDRYKDKHISLCYDSGHANAWSKSIDWLSLYGDRLAAIHLHDNNGIEDSHNIPFSGTINWDSVMKGINNSSYNGSLTLEAEYRGEEDINLLKEFLERTYQSGLKLLRKQ